MWTAGKLIKGHSAKRIFDYIADKNAFTIRSAQKAMIKLRHQNCS